MNTFHNNHYTSNKTTKTVVGWEYSFAKKPPTHHNTKSNLYDSVETKQYSEEKSFSINDETPKDFFVPYLNPKAGPK